MGFSNGQSFFCNGYYQVQTFSMASEFNNWRDNDDDEDHGSDEEDIYGSIGHIQSSNTSFKANGSSVPLADSDGLPVEEAYSDDEPAPPPTAAPKSVVVERVQVPRPTATRIISETARSIAAQRSQDAIRRAAAPPDPRAKVAFEKATRETELVMSECMPYYEEMLGYKRKYDGKIDYQFKKKYTVNTFSLPEWKFETGFVRKLLNTRRAPQMIKKMISQFAELTEALISDKLNHPFINNRNSAEKVRDSLDSGEWDDDIDQVRVFDLV